MRISLQEPMRTESRCVVGLMMSAAIKKLASIHLSKAKAGSIGKASNGAPLLSRFKLAPKSDAARWRIRASLGVRYFMISLEKRTYKVLSFLIGMRVTL